MKFFNVAQAFNEIEKESGRLKITKLLAELLKPATPQEAQIISYLSLGNLNSIYIGTQFNFAEKSMLKVVAKLLDKTAETIKSKANQLGDLGYVVEQYDWEIKDKKELTVIQLDKELQEFLKISGEGSKEKKEKDLLAILKELDPVAAKYVVRIVLGKLRLGFSDMTLLDAFSFMEVGDKSIRVELEEAYNICADIGLIIKTLKEDGIEGIKKIKITPGIPIRPAAAERSPNAKTIIKKLGHCVAQPKLDGFRLQVHIDKRKAKPKVYFFSRNLLDMSQMFPDLRKAVLDLNVETLIVEGEAIAYNVQTGTFLPFQETVKRRRKHGIDKTAQDFPLKLYFFDILYFDGKSLLDEGHEQRRKILLDLFKSKHMQEQNVIFAIGEEKIDDTEELNKYFEKNIAEGLEGVVVKKPDAIYKAGKRNFNWIKLKREETDSKLDDTIDCVILGYYAGRGKRASFGIGALLIGVFNKKEDKFQTVAKLGTGFTDAALKEVKKKCDKIEVKNKPKNVDCAKDLYPDVWVTPEIVCLVRADEITLSPMHKAGQTNEHSGLALRFPRFMGYRPDKSAQDATTVTELKELYHIQHKGKKGTTRKAKTSKRDIINSNVMSIF